MPNGEVVKVAITRDGTIVFDRKAVDKFRLREVAAISVGYIAPRLYLRPVKTDEPGICLEEAEAGAIIAPQGADFLDDLGVLPRRSRRFEAWLNESLGAIIVGMT
jgi:hypothetical protein